MKNITKILFLLLIVGCGSDAGSKIISSSGVIDPNTGNGGNNGNNGGNNGDSTANLNVELISNYNDDTASFSTVFGNYTRSFIVHTQLIMIQMMAQFHYYLYYMDIQVKHLL